MEDNTRPSMPVDLEVPCRHCRQAVMSGEMLSSVACNRKRARLMIFFSLKGTQHLFLGGGRGKQAPEKGIGGEMNMLNQS